MSADGIWGPVAPWIGLLDLVGVAVAFVAWLYLRGAEDRTRAVAAAVGGTLLVGALFAAFDELNQVTSFLLAFRPVGAGGPRWGPDVLLAAGGVAAGVAAVFAGHRYLAPESPVEDDLDEDDDEDDYDERGFVAGGVAEVLGDAEPLGDDEDYDDDYDDDDYDDEPGPRRSLLPGGVWVDVAAVAVAIGLPTFGIGGLAALYGGGQGLDRDVTTFVGLAHILAGLIAALPLLVVAGRDDTDDPWLLGSAFGVIGLGAVMLPVWSDSFTNEFWVAFGAGLGTGLLAAATFSLLLRALPLDRTLATAGVVLAGALLVASNALNVKIVRDQQQAFFDDFDGGGFEVPVDSAP